MRSTIRKALGATVAAAALVFGAAVAPALAAAPNEIDMSRNGSSSITITKVEGSATNDRQQGLEDAGATPVEGAQFKIEKLAMQNDITTPAGQAEAASLTPESPVDGSFAAQTVDAGTATVGGLEFGVYKITETVAPAGYNPGAPFLVYLPFTHPTDLNTWVYDAYVYPKNTKVNVEKTVEDEGKQVGDKITYTITSDVPVELKSDGSGDYRALKKFNFVDDLDDRLGITAEDVTINILVDDQTIALDAATDFTVNIEATSKVTAALTDAGLAKVQNYIDQGKNPLKLEMKLTPVVNDWGVVPNEAIVIINNGEGSGDTEDQTIPTNRVISVWGKLDIDKVNKEGAKLAGAEFKLYECTDPKNLGNELTVAGKNLWTTDNSGAISIEGIHVGNYADDAQVNVVKNYCLVETKAPAGYELLTEPVLFTLEYTKAAEDKAAPLDQIELKPSALNEFYKNQQITNLPAGGQLPLTGGAGVAMFAVIGAAIIGGGLYAARRYSKKTAN